ncbi:GNAT family N-acetyltransferase [Engelhardtia mirabilis]|uniref:N-acetyltransferase domain-containing protein n=1 Tax=Engelhardtia mirabilis TaxID=2528011 RepID=A0A518BSY9_9BACT|nr:hypothetical protein Pla133_51980 [Planctomycetes bacterium Pla133]QDV04400.1 hypothetical protein Pla86_51950 [Planctomycetes bacterium Pla86]
MSVATKAEQVLPGARQLIERVMRGGGSVAAECPLVFEGPLGAQRPGRVVALSEDGAVCSACAILPRDFVVPGGSLRLGLIGYVATDTNTRGRGFASSVLDAAEAALADRGCVASLLWADDASFYQRRGYHALGRELDFALDAGALEALPHWASTRAYDPERDSESVQALMAARPIRVERSLDETRALLAIPGLRTRVATRGDRVVAYACEGKGPDLRGAVHDWGGETLAVLALIGELAAPHVAAGRRAFVLTPHASLPTVRGLLDLGLRAEPGVLGMGRLLAPEAARALLGPAAAHLPQDQLLAALLPTPADADSCGPFGALFAWGLDSI